MVAWFIPICYRKGPQPEVVRKKVVGRHCCCLFVVVVVVVVVVYRCSDISGKCEWRRLISLWRCELLSRGYSESDVIS